MEISGLQLLNLLEKYAEEKNDAVAESVLFTLKQAEVVPGDWTVGKLVRQLAIGVADGLGVPIV